jgi:hypothetical protein
MQIFGTNCIIRSFMEWLITKYYSGDQVENMRWARHVARMMEKINRYRVFMGKSKRKITWKAQKGNKWRAF